MVEPLNSGSVFFVGDGQVAFDIHMYSIIPQDFSILRVKFLFFAQRQGFFTTKGTKYTKENLWKGDPLIIRPTLVTYVSFVFNQANTP